MRPIEFGYNTATNATMAAGTVVATVDSVTDADSGDTHTFALTEDSGGNFEIDAVTGDITNTTLIDGSSVTSHSITVETTDAGGNTYSEDVDLHFGTSGDDSISAGSGSDILYGFGGADTLDGGDGSDVIDGGGGDDILTGGGGSDTIWGGNNNDTITGNSGDDTLYGGDSNDLFIFAEGDGTDTAYGGQGGGWTDVVELHDATGGSDIGTYGTDWTLVVTEGSIQSQDANSITLSDDANGVITLQDGSTFNFQDFERIDW